MAKHPALFLMGGIMALFIAMGIGRFAYTPILPLMQNHGSFSNAFAGYLASINYAGYMLGAILAGVIPWRGKRIHYFRINLVISILTTACMGLTHLYWIWLILRFISGLASAFIFVLSSSVVLDALAANGRTKWSGIFYGGVGFGIFFTGFAVPLFNRLFNWEGAWIGLAVTSVILGTFSWFGLKEETQTRSQTSSTAKWEGQPTPRLLPWLIASYGCEGLGYIVTGTFIVSIAEKIPGLSGNASLVWMFVGLAAAPSCIIWSMLGKRNGFVLSLGLAMILQAVGIVIPVIWNSPAGAILSALLFGATFMGITTLATTLARSMNPTGSSRTIGSLTAVYGAGQMIGPSGAGILASITHNYNGALVGAAIVVLLGSVLLWVGQAVQTKNKKGMC
ncbi:MAG TPA: YbfB/YjiJ family MFS transporter [Bacillota bacterium]|nr:YbfB/YjiJ family MFS transporter [Bacillota bacterium]